MKVLLRLQAVLVRRTLTNRGVVVGGVVGGVPMLLLFGGMAPTGHRVEAVAEVALTFGMICFVMGMVGSLGSMDAIRWAAPLRARTVLAANVVFWIAAWTLVTAAVTAARAHTRSAGLLEFAELMLGGIATAFVPVVFRGIHRRASVGAVGMTAVTALMSFVSARTVSRAAFRIWSVDKAFVFVALLVVASTLSATGAWLFLRGELLPAASGAPETEHGRPGPSRRSVWSPTATILRATWPPLATGFVVVVYTGIQFLQSGRDVLPLLWLPILVVSLGGTALASWQWLLPTPIDRQRAFNILFLPVVMVALANAAAQLVAKEVEGDRTAFFSRDPHRSLRRDPLALRDLLEVDARTQAYRAPDVSRMANRVREHLHSEYGLRLPAERIAATILRGWPAALPDASSPQIQEAVCDAMDRVHAEIEPDILVADRLGSLAGVLVAVLVSMFFIRLQVTGFYRLTSLTFVLLGLFFISVDFVPLVAPVSEMGVRIVSAREWIYDAITNGGPPGAMLLVAATATAAFLIWRSAANAFRRLEIRGIPPQSATRWWGNRR